MSTDLLWEPNPVPGRLITPDYLNELGIYSANLAALGRCSGLLPSDRSESGALPCLDPPDGVALAAIRAIGVRGFPIVADNRERESAIRTLDTQDLPVGTHKVYACLSRDKVPCGELFEDPAPEGHHGNVRGRTHRRARVVLEAGKKRFDYLDWIQVAVIERVRTAGAIRTYLDERFHPAVADMRAYARPNPLELLAKQALQGLETVGEPSSNAALKVELTTLLNIAGWATPLQAFVQTQRCLGLMRVTGATGLGMDGRLEGYQYDPESFCKFLADLTDSLANGEGVPYPSTLEIDSVLYMKVPGELAEEEEFWSWTPARDGFVASGLAVYMPNATQGALPVVRYGWKRLDGGNFQIADTGKAVSAPGSAIVLGELRQPVSKLYVTVAAETLRQRLRQHLGDGHALYYF